jgi:hypothetical protein
VSFGRMQLTTSGPPYARRHVASRSAHSTRAAWSRNAAVVRSFGLVRSIEQLGDFLIAWID